MFDIEDYDYELPAESIAQVPVSRRDRSRLLVLDRKEKTVSDRFFFDLPTLLRPGDLLVVNDTRVVPARLFGRKESGGRVEILVLGNNDSVGEDPSNAYLSFEIFQTAQERGSLFFESGVSGKVREVLENGLVKITFSGDCSIDSLLEEKGHMPLPPYIKRGEKTHYSHLDRERYQTIFAKKAGAVAAPTAGLHFTEDLIDKLKSAGISVAYLTLHVGHGTFRPVRTKDIRKHHLGDESYHIEPETADAIEQTEEKAGGWLLLGQLS